MSFGRPGGCDETDACAGNACRRTHRWFVLRGEHEHAGRRFHEAQERDHAPSTQTKDEVNHYPVWGTNRGLMAQLSWRAAPGKEQRALAGAVDAIYVGTCLGSQRFSHHAKPKQFTRVVFETGNLAATRRTFVGLYLAVWRASSLHTARTASMRAATRPRTGRPT